MTTITPNLIDSEPVQLEELDSEQSPSLAFKEMIDEMSSATDSLKNLPSDNETDEEDLSKCVISIFELPRSHFSVPEEEEEIKGISGNEILLPSGVPSAPMPVAASFSSSNNAAVLSSQSVKLPAEIEALFEKMAATMLVLASSNETETTVFLDAPQFSQSPFFGTRITIKEFSTAPKAFNIEIASSSLALKAIDVYKPALLTAFAKGDFNFSIGRFDTEILQEDRPLFHRKEAVSKDQEDL